MVSDSVLLPPDAGRPDPAADDLLGWMGERFDRFGDVYRASLHGAAAYVTRRPGDARHVLVTNHQNYVKGRLIKRVALLLGGGLMASEGALWRRQRRMMQPAFRREAIVALAAAQAAASLRLCEMWQQAAERHAAIDLGRDVGSAVLGSVLQAIFGPDCARVAPHFALLSQGGGRSLAFAQRFRGLAEIVLQVIGERRAAADGGDDMLGMLIAARDRDSGEAIGERQLLNEVMTLVVAGHETTAATLCWVWHALSQYPEVEARLHDEIDTLLGDRLPAAAQLPGFAYAWQVIEEVLRLYPPGWLLTRRALREDRLGEYAVPAKTEIYIPVFFVQRHPLLWPQPDRFDPDRFAPAAQAQRPALAMLPFSAGPRNCIGEPFARQQMLIHVLVIARRVRLRLVSPASIAFAAGVNLRSAQPLMMVAERRLRR